MNHWSGAALTPTFDTVAGGGAVRVALCDVDFQTAVRTALALFSAAMECICASYWEILSCAAINSDHCRGSHRITRGAAVSDNTNWRPPMTEPFPLPTKPEDIIPSLVKRFNSGDVSA